MKSVCAFFVTGTPAPAGSKTAFIPKGWTRAIITDACKRTKPWQQEIKHAALDNYRGIVITEPLHVEFVFLVTRPKAHYGTGKNSETLKGGAPQHPSSKPDVLKLARAVEDALTGIVWKDDCQIVSEKISKRYCENDERSGVSINVATFARETGVA